MSRIQYFVAASIDGFIATTKDDLAWLLRFDGFEGGKESYETFMAGVGCIVMGGETYAWLMEHEPGNWPYHSTPCYVFTRHEHVARPARTSRSSAVPSRSSSRTSRITPAGRTSGW
ncbi:uncharacterized protein YwjB [Arthrobacter sp. Hiyo4]|nr:uncharacterized protein YwjB [Arthrobacter sp. Hiyo4]